MAFFQIQEIPSVFVNTDYIERFQYTADAEGTGTMTIHFVSGENVTFTGHQAPEAYEALIGVLQEEERGCDHDDED